MDYTKEELEKRKYRPMKKEDIPNLVDGKTIIKWDNSRLNPRFVEYGIYTNKHPEKENNYDLVAWQETDSGEITWNTLCPQIWVDPTTLKSFRRLKLKDLKL